MSKMDLVWNMVFGSSVWRYWYYYLSGVFYVKFGRQGGEGVGEVVDDVVV